MQKINNITTDGNNNINIQDVSGKIVTINVNDNKAIEEFMTQHKAQTAEIVALLRQKQEPVFQQFVEQITVTENRVSRYLRYALIAAASVAFVYFFVWYFILQINISNPEKM